MSRWRKFLDHTQPISAEQRESDASNRALPLVENSGYPSSPQQNPSKELSAKAPPCQRLAGHDFQMAQGYETTGTRELYLLPQQGNGSGLEGPTLKIWKAGRSGISQEEFSPAFGTVVER